MGIFDDYPEVDTITKLCPVSYNAGIDDAIEQLQYAREEGESDLRQIIQWVRKCKIKGLDND